GGVPPGAAMQDAILSKGSENLYLTDIVAPRFTLLFAQAVAAPKLSAPIDLVAIATTQSPCAPLRDTQGQFAARYEATPGCGYLLRPDGYVAARFRDATVEGVEAAFGRARGKG
ncbi:MAG: FAD-dependent oxidoreductase, partial [Hyphomicrobiales bacterium]|nr:FAD-dependent oxidoreductase [Hyphomicrobiales bacterium]